MSSSAEVMFTEPAEWELLEADATPTQDVILPLPEPVMSTYEPRIYLGPVSPTTKYDAYFRSLARDWKRDTSHLSLISQRVTHPAYKQILGMGRTALPLILAELSVEPDHWFHALSLLADDNPIPSGFCGTVSEAAELWLDWGHSRNLIPDAAERAVPDIP